MKTCPVCSAKAFDDARICYGCMHSFEAESQRKKEPSPLDNTTLEWLAPENLRPLTASGDDGWISGNETPPWIESYKEDIDLAEPDPSLERSACNSIPNKVDPSTEDTCWDEVDYEVPLEVYAQSWYGDAYEIPSYFANCPDRAFLQEQWPSQALNVAANCAVQETQRDKRNMGSQEVVVRLEFEWVDREKAVPVRVAPGQDWLSKTPVGALSAAC